MFSQFPKQPGNEFSGLNLLLNLTPAGAPGKAPASMPRNSCPGDPNVQPGLKNTGMKPVFSCIS